MKDAMAHTGPPASPEETSYVLRLFVTGNTPKSLRAVKNIRHLCEELLKGRYDLEVIDLYQQPELAAREQLLAAPTLVKVEPLPRRRVVGDMSDRQRLVSGLNLRVPH